MTKMACPGEGEATFLEMLKKASTYSVSDSTLNFMMGDIAIMRFSKK
jgi:heat shock protein HslJ